MFSKYIPSFRLRSPPRMPLYTSSASYLSVPNDWVKRRPVSHR